MLRGVWAVLVLCVATVACGVPAIVISLIARQSNATMRLGRIWSAVMLLAVGARVRYEGLECCAGYAPRVFIANHASNVDIWVLMRVLPANAAFVANQELRRVPVIGQALATSGVVFVDRSNRARAIRSLTIAAEMVRSGRSVILFPEGTRSRDGTLQPFKKGPFHLALQAGVPVIPVAIRGSWNVLPPGTIRVTPGAVMVRFLEPIASEPFGPDDVEGLLQSVHSALARDLAAPEGRA